MKQLVKYSVFLMLLGFIPITAQNAALNSGVWNDCNTWGYPLIGITRGNDPASAKTIDNNTTVTLNTNWNVQSLNLSSNTSILDFNGTTNALDLNIVGGTAQSCLGTITALNCTGGILSGPLYKNTSIPAAVTITRTVPYSGGNNGPYTAISVNSTGVTGLTASLAAGNFSSSGNLTFRITGTPSAIGTASFPITIGGLSCTFSVTVQNNNAVVNPTFIGGTTGWTGNGCLVWSYGSFCPDFTATPVGSTADQAVCTLQQTISSVNTYGATLSFEIGWGYGNQGGVIGDIYYNGVLYARFQTRNVNDTTSRTVPQNGATGVFVNTAPSSNVAHVNFTLPVGISSSGILLIRFDSVNQGSGDSISFANFLVSKGY